MSLHTSSSLRLEKESFADDATVADLTERQRETLAMRLQLYTDDETSPDAIDPDDLAWELEDAKKTANYRIIDPKHPNDPLVGAVSLKEPAKNSLHVDILSIRSRERNQRYGARVLGLLELLAVQDGKSKITLYPSGSDAERFYERHGFSYTDDDSLAEPGELVKQIDI